MGGMSSRMLTTRDTPRVLVRAAIASGADVNSIWPLPVTRETRATSAFPLLAYAVLSASAGAVQLLVDASARVDALVYDVRVTATRRRMDDAVNDDFDHWHGWSSCVQKESNCDMSLPLPLPPLISCAIEPDPHATLRHHETS